MLHYYVKKSYNEEPQLTKEPPTDHGWVYGATLTNDEIAQLAQQYSLDTGILRDVHDTYELPRAEYSQSVLYMFIRIPHQTASGNVASMPFLAILNGSLLLTISTKEYVTPSTLFDHTNITMKDTRMIFLHLISYVTELYEGFIHKTGKYIYSTEQRLHTHEVDNTDFINFVTVEHDLNEYHTNLSALQALLKRLHDNNHALFTDDDCEFIDDMSLHVNQLLVATESHKNTITSIRNAYTTISNNTLNQRMKKLTLLTLLVALPNVFFGMFGMNVALPFADQPWAYGFITGFSIIIVVAVVILVRKMRF